MPPGRRSRSILRQGRKSFAEFDQNHPDLQSTSFRGLRPPFESDANRFGRVRARVVPAVVSEHIIPAAKIVSTRGGATPAPEIVHWIRNRSRFLKDLPGGWVTDSRSSFEAGGAPRSTTAVFHCLTELCVYLRLTSGEDWRESGRKRSLSNAFRRTCIWMPFTRKNCTVLTLVHCTLSCSRQRTKYRR